MGTAVQKFDALRQQAAQASAQQTVKVVQLPLWPEPTRGVPNSVLRSALFGVLGKGRRRYIDGEQLPAVDGIAVRYKGERLDQDDLSVWDSIVHAVRMQPLGDRCRVTSRALLKLMDLTDTGKNRKTLHKRIERLVANAVTVRQGRYTYIGSLIHFAAKDEKTKEWVIELDPRLRQLFAADQFTLIDWQTRQTLRGQLAKWLHGFYSSHAEPYPIKVETLWRLSGSEAKSLRHFREELREAFAELQAVTNWEWEIGEHDLACVRKTRLPDTQKRHLIKRALSSKKRR